jgi:monofunctional biosynthetic peptidoglycan transglycosylase
MALLLSSLVGWGAYEYFRWPDLSLLRKANPRTTAMMELRDDERRRQGLKPRRRQIWASYGAISEHLKKAVLVSEDASFYDHAGVDLHELKEALKRDWQQKRFARGASTLTMQLAKNLYLSPSKNPLRKIREMALAWQLERTLNKRRIFEIYLNVVEWGDGIYGAEAASRHYFSKTAAGLTVEEAAALAAMLPNPRNPGGRATLRRKELILTRLRQVGYIGSEPDRPLAPDGEQRISGGEDNRP